MVLVVKKNQFILVFNHLKPIIHPFYRYERIVNKYVNLSRLNVYSDKISISFDHTQRNLTYKLILYRNTEVIRLIFEVIYRAISRIIKVDYRYINL